MLDSVDIPLPLVPVLEAAMACPAWVPEITSDRHLTSILTDAHLDTWFLVQDANDVAATLKETRPGDSLWPYPSESCAGRVARVTGLAFGYTKSLEPLFTRLVDPQEVVCSDFAFADDTAFLRVLPARLPLVEMLSLVHDWALGIHNLFVERALTPNYDVGKSSLLLVPAGKNSTHNGYWLPATRCLERACVVPSQARGYEQNIWDQ